MPRTSPTHYIAPSAITIAPNANDSFNDLTVYIAKGAKIKIYSPKAGINTISSVYQEWTLSGRNRRLADSAKPYTIYARLPKNNKNGGYLVFAPKVRYGNVWEDKYPYVTPYGLADIEGVFVSDGNWYIRLGDVSLPENGERTVTFDTGILGTDQYNNDWALNPDALPLRIDLNCTVNDEDAGPTPYVYWSQRLMLTASLVEGWTGTGSQRFDHWTISRNSGDEEADKRWLTESREAVFRTSGSIELIHERSGIDDFNGAVATLFTVTAWGKPESDSSSSHDDTSGTEELVPLKTATITILAETVETYDLETSETLVSYNPETDTYSPANGVRVRIRAKSQDGTVLYPNQTHINTIGLHVYYLPIGDEGDTPTELSFTNGIATLPIALFQAGKGINLWLENGAQVVLARTTVGYVRFGAKGDTPINIYRWYKEGLTPKVPTATNSDDPAPATGDATGAANVYSTDKWSHTTPDRPATGDWALWMCSSIRHADGTRDAWSTPVRISGSDGDAGADGSDREYIYTRLSTYPFSGAAPKDINTGTVNGKSSTDKNHNDWIPTGWSDNAIAADKDNKYVYVSVREKAAGKDQEWGDFSTPVLWSNWGVQGSDGDGVQYVFKLYDHELTATERTNYIPVKPVTQNANGEWLPAGNNVNDPNTAQSWTDDPASSTANLPYCYCSTIKRTSGNWGKYEELGLWSRWSEDGNGISSVVRTYNISALSSTVSETTAPSGINEWLAASPAVTEKKPYLWCREVVTYTKSGTTTKYHMMGARGDNGIDAQDVEWAYIRTKTDTAPVITADSSYTDSAGKTYTADDHLPRVMRNSDIESDNSGNSSKTYECTDDPKGVDSTWRYEWEIKRTKGAATNGHRTWQPYSGTMTLHNNYAASALVIDIDNDNDQFGADSTGKVLVAQTRTTNLTMLYGASVQAFTAQPTAKLYYEDGTEVANSVATVAVDAFTTGKTSYKITVTVKTTGSNTAVFATQTGMYALISGTCGMGTLSIRFTLGVVKSGAAGENPVIWQAVPSMSSIPFSRDDINNLTPASRSFNVYVTRTVGNTTTQHTSATGLTGAPTFKWGWDDSTTAQKSGQAIGAAILISSTDAASHSQVWVELSTGDRETVPIVRDGAKGEHGLDYTENLLHGTANIEALTSPGIWAKGTWRAASQGTGSRTVTDVDSVNDPVPTPAVTRMVSLASDNGAVDISQDAVPVKAGETYTMSCYAQGQGSVRLQYGRGKYLATAIPVSLDSGWKRIAYSFTAQSSGGTSDYVVNGFTNIYFGVKGGGEVNLCGFKLEKGEKTADETFWTPSPWDLTGVDGAASVRLDIDNEMDSVQTSSGLLVLTARTVSTVVRLYEGGEEIDISNASITVSGGPDKAIATYSAGAEPGGKGRKLSWAFIAGKKMAAAYYIAISYVHDGTTYRAVFSIIASMGQPVYQLLPSQSSLYCTRNSDNTLSAPEALSLKILRIDGSETGEYDATSNNISELGLIVRYATGDLPLSPGAGLAWPSTNSVQPKTTDDIISIALYNAAGILLDKESVPVVKDGENGAKGEDSYSVYANPSSVHFNCDANGVSIDTSTKTVGLSMYKGATIIRFTAAVTSATNCKATVSGTNVNISTMKETDSYYDLSKGGSVVVKLTSGTVERELIIPIIGNMKGDDGPRGATGRMYYMAGQYSGTTQYTRTDALCPIVYYLVSDDTNTYEWWYLTKDSAQGETPAVGSKYWSPLEDFGVVLTDAIFVKQFARFGSAIITGDWLISTHGTINGTPYEGTVLSPDEYTNELPVEGSDKWEGKSQAAYTWFDPGYPIKSVYGKRTVNGTTWRGYNFVPNYAVDLLTGRSYQNEAYIKGEVHATSGEFTGTIHANDGEFTGTIHANDGEFTGTIHANDGEFTGEINATGGKIGDTEILNHQAVYYLLSNLIAFKTGNGNVISNTSYMADTDAYMDIRSSGSISEVALPQHPIGGSLVFIYNRKSSAITIRSRSGNFLELSVTTITLAAGHLFIGFFIGSGASSSNRCAIIRQ